jgi:flagellar biosynthesis/type III secretory pathway chaperone
MHARSFKPVTAVLLETIAALEQESAVLAGRSDTLLTEVSLRKSRWLHEMADTMRTLAPAERAGHHALAERARELNDRNARLLAARLVVTRSRLDVLTGASTSTYGADGRASTPARSAGAVVA